MKKILCLLILIGLSLSFSNFMNEKHYDSYTGYIKMYGNEPFSYPCLVLDDGKVINLSIDKKMKDSIIDSQGKKIRINGYYNLKSDVNVNDKKIRGSLTVESFEYVDIK